MKTNHFFLPMKVPTKTFQEKKLRTVKGRAVLYTPPELVEIRQKYISALMPYAPKEPMEGPVRIRTVWCFPADGNHPPMAPKITKPDTDNLVKLLKDCMTECGFWKDDAQVCSEAITKCYSDKEGIYVEIIEFTGL